MCKIFCTDQLLLIPTERYKPCTTLLSLRLESQRKLQSLEPTDFNHQVF